MVSFNAPSVGYEDWISLLWLQILYSPCSVTELYPKKACMRVEVKVHTFMTCACLNEWSPSFYSVETAQLNWRLGVPQNDDWTLTHNVLARFHWVLMPEHLCRLYYFGHMVPKLPLLNICAECTVLPVHISWAIMTHPLHRESPCQWGATSNKNINEFYIHSSVHRNSVLTHWGQGF